jgi:O-antigen/teichoic acid export membrane protein
MIVAPISLLLVPFTLYKLGVAGYGTWAILSTIINLAWLMDPGLGPTVTKFVAEFSGTNDLSEIRRVLDASLALCLFMSALASCFLWFCSHVIIREFFSGPASPSASEILSLWPLVLLCISTFLMEAPFLALINGRQRMDLTNALIFTAELFSALTTVVVLCAGAKVRGLLVAQLVTSLLILVGSIIISSRLLPSVTPNPFRCNFVSLRKIISFSAPLYAGYVMTTLQGELGKLYLARFVGVVPVGWYSVAIQGAIKVKRIPDPLLGPLLAAASQLDAGRECKKLEELHFRTHKYLALVAVPLVVFVVTSAKTLVHLWVGTHLEPIAITFALLVIGNLFTQVGTPTYFIMVARGILTPAVCSAVLAAALNIVLSYIFIKYYGFSGAALGTAIPMIISTVYFFMVCRRHFHAQLYQTLRRAYVKPLLCSLVAITVVPMIALLRLRSLTGLLVEMIVYGAVYLAGLALSGFFDRFDLANVERQLPFVLKWRMRVGLVAVGGTGTK